MHKAAGTIVAVITLLLPAAFVFAFEYATQMAIQPDQTGNRSMDGGGAITSIEATTTADFLGRYPTFLLLSINMHGNSGGYNAGVITMRYYPNANCTGTVSADQTPSQISSSYTAFGGETYQDVYLDLTGTLAPTTTTRCILFSGMDQQNTAGWNIRTNVNQSLLFFQLAGTSDYLSAGDFSITVGQATSTSFFGSSATSTGSCDSVESAAGWAICSAFAYLFIPDTDTLAGFFAIPSTASTKFPFSWIYGVQTQISTMSASSTQNMSTLSFNLSSLGIGSTTAIGNILPNATVFSSSTITQYIGAGTWSTFQTLISTALWLLLVGYIFNRGRRLAEPV